MSQTAVEILLSKPESTSEAIANLNEFFQYHERHAALRLAVVGLVSINTKDHLQWEEIAIRFNKLFEHTIIDQKPVEVYANKLKRFATGAGAWDKNLSAYLSLFVLHEVERSPALLTRTLIAEAFSIAQVLEQVQAYIRYGRPEILYPNTLGYDVGALCKIFRQSLGITNDNDIINHLFGGHSHSDERNVSHYVMYRYATRRAKIIKSFLTILSPKVNGYGCYSFTHVYGGSLTKDGRPTKDSKRIARGPLLGFQHSIYFVGSAGLTEGPITLKNQAIKAFALPHTVFVPDYRLLTGALLSTSLSWRPIVARCAFVHLGFRSKKGAIDDEFVKIRFMDSNELEKDIKEVCTVCQVPKDYFAEDPAIYVRKKINNCPDADRTTKVEADGIVRAIAVEDGHKPPDY
jgi:hypothetical protein